MSLAARCPACRTAFRVVPDQLRVCDGWVRCGRCGDVFDANETLFDVHALAASAPRSATAPGSDAAAPPAAEAAPPESARDDAADEEAAQRGPVAPVDEPPADPLVPRTAPAAAWTPEAPMPSDEPASVAAPAPPEATAPWPSVDGAADHVGAVVAEAEPALAHADHAAALEVARVDDAARDAVAAEAAEAASADDRIEPSLAAASPSADATTAVAAPEAETPATPGFVREAERAERWQSPEMRALLGGAAVLLAGAALIQGLRGFHAPLTAEWPQARTWVEPLCRLAGCQFEPRRRLDALSVEGSSLVQLDGSALTRLSLVLRNRDRGEVLLPAIELTLTDVQGTVVARKVFAAGELGASNAAIAGGAELALQGALDTGGLPVVGYTIELFYP